MTSGSFDDGVISFGAPNYLLEIVRSEHDDTANTAVSKSGMYAWDATNMVWRRVSADASGQIVTSDSFNIPAYDYIDLNYTGTQLTSVDYKAGGAGGTVVATLTLNYSGSQLTSVAVT
jgi:hypothetical protein